jgi:hypothetical protein
MPRSATPAEDEEDYLAALPWWHTGSFSVAQIVDDEDAATNPGERRLWAEAMAEKK